MGQLSDRWHALGSSHPNSSSPYPPPGRQQPEGPNLSSKENTTKAPATPRRVVLLGENQESEVEQILCEYQGSEAHHANLSQEVQRFATEHPGRQVAAEWQGRLGWVRFLWCQKD